jgi:hypothetical protein
MAVRWVPQPNAPVGSNEQIGRRLFGEPGLVGADDQVRPAGSLDYRHFEEKRGAGEVSLDRMGATGFDNKVKNYLIPKADYAGTTFRLPLGFDGWVILTARLLENPAKGINFPIVASPERPNEPEHIQHNPYHAHVCRPAGHDGHSTALHLKHIFQKGRIEPRQRPKGWRAVLGFFLRIVRWATRFLPYLPRR